MPWIRVTRDKPCPICGKPDWCSVAADGSVVCCMREPSEKECKSGGWIHLLNSTVSQKVRNVFRRQDAPKKYYPPDYWYNCILAAPDDPYRYEANRKLADSLGVPLWSLLACGMAYDYSRKAYMFPMYDGKRNMIGIRLRRNGDKWSIRGSRNGLFWAFKGANRDSVKPLILCEGATDCAVLTSLYYEVLGRPSCMSGNQYIKQFLRGTNRDVIIVGDRDGPGVEGANRLKRDIFKLAKSVKIVVPPAKDVREWYNNGATKKDFEELLGC